MEAVEPVAQSLSTYGLYAIVAVLALVVVYLYRRVSDLEKELRTSLAGNASELAKLLAQTNEALRENTRAFGDFQATLADVKTTIQILMERMKP